jgi:hypothetical protein
LKKVMEKTKKEIEESHKPTPFLPGGSYKKSKLKKKFYFNENKNIYKKKKKLNFLIEIILF